MPERGLSKKPDFIETRSPSGVEASGQSVTQRPSTSLRARVISAFWTTPLLHAWEMNAL